MGNVAGKWHVGQRVSREDNPNRLGTAIEIGQSGIKVKWDSGRTSYYRADAQGNAPLKRADRE
jgi:hypothetical protein